MRVGSACPIPEAGQNSKEEVGTSCEIASRVLGEQVALCVPENNLELEFFHSAQFPQEPSRLSVSIQQ